MTPEKIAALYTVDELSIEGISLKTKISTYRITRILQKKGVVMRLASYRTPARRKSERSARDRFRAGEGWPASPAAGLTPEESAERYCAAIYAACPFGFDLKAARAAIAMRAVA